MPHFEQTAPVENENIRPIPDCGNGRFAQNIVEEGDDVVAESVQVQEAAAKEVTLVLERIRQLSNESLTGNEVSKESTSEYQNEKLESMNRSLDDLFAIAERRSKRASGLRDNLTSLARAPKDFFIETRAIFLLRQLKGELGKALISQEEGGEAMRVLSRIINGMGDNENIKTFYSHNAGIEKKLLALGTEILLDNQDIFLESLNNPDSATEKVIGKILSGAVAYQPETDRDIEALSIKFLPSIQKRVEVLRQDAEGEDNILEHYALVLRPAVLGANQEQAEIARQVWSETLLGGTNVAMKKRIIESYVYTSGPKNQQKKEVVSYLVRRIGLDPEKFYDADKNKKEEGWSINENHVKNILSALALESSVIGSVRKLAEGYGIQSFARYPKEILLRQLETEEDLESSYGIVLNPREDWNGGFMCDQRVFSELADSARDEKMNVRVFECESKMDAIKKLIRLNRKYGEGQKMKFAVVGGHGDRSALQFGQEKRETLEKNDLEGKAMKELRSFFSEDATIVLNACSTGDDFGLGETLSRLTKIKVIAPDRPANLRSLRVTSGGAIAVEYRQDSDNGKSPLRAYVSGKLEVGKRSEIVQRIEDLV